MACLVAKPCRGNYAICEQKFGEGHRVGGTGSIGWMKGVLIVFTALLLARLTLIALMPVFRRYALARPNARSTHRIPTPQGGGIGILIGGLGIGVPASLNFGGQWQGQGQVLLVLAGLSVLIAALGAIDDLRALGWRIRIAAQTLIVAALLLALPEHLRLLGAVPLVVERVVATLLGVWFINLTNFMDGIDGMLVAGTAPLFLVVGSGFLGLSIPDPLALALGGGMLGFLILNRPPARLFAGDVGALAIGFLAAACLFFVATEASLVAAIILPLYFVADATSTLFLRALRGATLTQAHRDHAYQQAIDHGMPCTRIITEVALLNLGLAALAAFAIWMPSVALLLLVLAIVATAMLILRFRRAGR